MNNIKKDPLRLTGSRDLHTGQVYFPPRPLAADGSLRETEETDLSQSGTLYTWTKFARQYFGQVDLPEGVRIQTLLEGEDHEIGANYEVVLVTDEDGNESWRFARV